jgi:dienelactone hydrolase
VVVLPDADQTPEQTALLGTGMARQLAEAGCQVLVPTLIGRGKQWPNRPAAEKTDQTHREWIYRQAFHMGRHIIGLEVQKALAAVDYFLSRGASSKVGVAGYGEGGLIAFYASAADSRIDAALVSGYFAPREAVWSEPIYRNVWGLLDEFGDAEIATLIAPRGLVVEFARVPDATGHKGDVAQPSFDQVKAEFHRIDSLLKPGFMGKRLVSGPAGEPAGPGSPEAIRAFLEILDASAPAAAERSVLEDSRRSFDPRQRQDRQLLELENYVQRLVRESEGVRRRFFLLEAMPAFGERSWNLKLRFDPKPSEGFIEQARRNRQYFHEEVLGRFDEPLLAPNPRSRKIYDTAKWTGYDVVLDVWPEVFAWGVLLVPKNIPPGERRPVVVCQHGRQGLPYDTVAGNREAYRDFAARLAERGFVVFAPHNLYRGEDRYRWLSRKANSVKASLFSFLIGQHDQILRWLETLPFVDGKRMAFYGLSYGGETAMRVPAVLEKYVLSICSGDFNHWTRKVASTEDWFSFMHTIEWEMPYFDMGNTFDYAEMAYLIFPRPFMVERGHHDLVAEDQWVAYEYAKVRWLYTQFGLANRTEIEFFNGGHTINGEGTFRFLENHLR